MVKVNIRGGILSPGDLIKMIRIATDCKAECFHLGERQNIYFTPISNESDKVSKALQSHHFDFEINTNTFPNIVSSYVSDNLFTTYNNWLSEGGYRDVLDSFDFRPKLKINVVDSNQGIAPLFTGNLNFISSASPNFWYLYLRRHTSKAVEAWPELTYGSDVGPLAALLQELLLSQPGMSINKLAAEVKAKRQLITMENDKELELPRVRFPNYEGLNKSGDQYWLGIYRRNNDFSVAFLESICKLCLDTKIGLLHLTPWKTLLIKGIREEHRIQWEKLLGKFGINIRHSASELNWQIKDGDLFAVKLKKYLVKQFDKRDVRTYGLSFAIRTGPMNVFSSVVIDRNPMLDMLGLKALDQYDIYYSEGFNPNNQHLTLYAQKLSEKHLPDYLTKLCRFFYEQLNHESAPAITTFREDIVNDDAYVFQCAHCFSIYDEASGDPAQGIAAGTTFATLPADYACALCENPKADFIKSPAAPYLKHN